jgi:glutathione S-transferase
LQTIEALDARISSGPFFFGEKLRSVDAALFPQIMTIADAPYEGPLKRAVRESQGLIAYCKRCEAAIFGGKDAT